MRFSSLFDALFCVVEPWLNKDSFHTLEIWFSILRDQLWEEEVAPSTSIAYGLPGAS